METTQIFRILILCAAALAVCRAEISISVKISNPIADIGDDVRISCHIKNEEKENFYVVWVKKLGQHEVEIGTNTKMNQVFEDTRRYSGNIEMQNADDISDVTFIIDIKAVEASDSGEIGCKLPKLHLEVFETLIVKSPFKTMSLSSGHVDGSEEVAYRDGESASFNEGDKRSFTCRATGGYPKPDMKLMLGDKDISSKFNKTVILKKEGISGLYALTYDVQLTNPVLEITYEFSKNDLVCIASIPETGYKNTSSIKIELSGYKPQFLCDKLIQVPLHKEDVNITCHVHADPPIQGNMTEMYWQRPSTGNDTIFPGDSHGQITAHLQAGKDEYEKVMTLEIGHVYMNNFQTYFFQATNTLGTVTHGVELRREPDYEHKTEAPAAGNTGEIKVPGKKDRMPSSCGLDRLIPGLLITTLLTVILI